MQDAVNHLMVSWFGPGLRIHLQVIFFSFSVPIVATQHHFMEFLVTPSTSISLVYTVTALFGMLLVGIFLGGEIEVSVISSGLHAQFIQS